LVADDDNESGDVPDWFQGYLFLSDGGDGTNDGSASKQKPLGLLARSLDVDECLACADGGYRRVSVRLYDWSGRQRGAGGGAGTTQEQQQQQQYDLGTADWTGGDMMKLSGECVRMRPVRLLTGRSAAPYVTGLFGSLWKRIVESSSPRSTDADAATGGKDPDTDRSPSVLDVLPDVAVVWGEMEVVVREES
jgi:hypothetical protein